MEPEVKQDDAPSPEVTTDNGVDLSPQTSETDTNEQVQQVLDKITSLLGDLPEYLTGFFGQYRRPIVTVALVVAAIIAVRLTLAVLQTVNEIPLLAPTFELIGLGYFAWFVYRYLLKASNRSELVSDFNAFKDQVLGNRDSN